MLRLFDCQPVELDDLVPRRVAGHDPDVAGRQVEGAREKVGDLVVGPPALGRRADAELPRIAQPPDDLRAAGAGRNPDAEPEAPPGRLAACCRVDCTPEG